MHQLILVAEMGYVFDVVSEVDCCKAELVRKGAPDEGE